MILIDLSQIMMASLSIVMSKKTEPDLDFIRHLTLNSLRMYRKKYTDEYGELVICCDGRYSWRKKYFPLYKIGRTTGRKDSPDYWTQVFECFDTIKSELKTTFPYKYIDVKGAEADDVIGVISRNISESEKVMIISSDHDFIQLHNNNVQQWNPFSKKIVNTENPTQYLFEHILRGDKGDGVPNVLSADDSIVNGIRQKPITKKYIDNFVMHNSHLNDITDEEIKNFYRNKKLIDLKETPKEIADEIWTEYIQEPKGKREDIPIFLKEKNLNFTEKTIKDF